MCIFQFWSISCKKILFSISWDCSIPINFILSCLFLIKILNEEQYNEIEKRIFLQLIDQNWKLHIQYLEQLRQVIGLRSYGQRDPLVEYKKEAFILFENLLSKLKYDLITILFNLKLIEKNDDQNDVQNEKSINTNNNPKCLLVTNREGKISRNERCEATGKKFKHCCGAL